MKQLLRDSSNYDESHNPFLPDKNKPWCLNCRLHTDYYSVYERRGKQVNKKFYCDVCDGDTYWPVNPNKFKFVGIDGVLFVVHLMSLWRFDSAIEKKIELSSSFPSVTLLGNGKPA